MSTPASPPLDGGRRREPEAGVVATVGPIAFLVGLVCMAWLIKLSADGVGAGSGRAWFVAVYLVFFFDLLDVAFRVVSTRLREAPVTTVDESPRGTLHRRMQLRPYAIVVSVYNAEDELFDFVRSFTPLKERVWVIDDASDDHTVVRLQQAGFRVIAAEVNRNKPGAIKTLLEHLPDEIESVLVVDPDVLLTTPGGADPLEAVERAVWNLQHGGHTATTPRIVVKPEGVLGRLQALEYNLAQNIGRRSLGDLAVNSGISLYRRVDLLDAMRAHSLSVYAEDLETSIVLLSRGGRVYFDNRFEAITDGKPTLRTLFSQRVGWSYGLMRVYVERFADVLKVGRSSPRATYHYLFYLGFLSIGMQPFRSVAALAVTLGVVNGLEGLAGLNLIPDAGWLQPRLIMTLYAQYTLIACVGLLLGTPRNERPRLLAVVPLYVFYSLGLILPATIGYLNWLSLRFLGRRLYADHFQAEESLQRQALTPAWQLRRRST